MASVAMMLGWGNVPPRETLERDIGALKARAQSGGGPCTTCKWQGRAFTLPCLHDAMSSALSLPADFGCTLWEKREG